MTAAQGPAEARPGAAPTRVRWMILAILTGFSFVSYLLRMNISVAAKFMMPEFSLSQIQMGQVFSSFMLGYALFQIPAGILGDRLGARLVLSAAALCWGLATLLTGLVPGLATQRAWSVFPSLLFLRFFLGVAEAATYPVAARVIANWIPSSERALSYAIIVAGMSLGSAITPPLVSWLMVNLGWRESFYLASGLAFLIAALWRSYATDKPERHPRVNPHELALISAGSGTTLGSPRPASRWALFTNRNICLLSLSYFFNGYVLFMFVFWFYLYLIEVRGFSILRGGFFAGLPFLLSAVMTPAGGALCDLASARLGRRWGRRIAAMGGFLLSAIFLLWGASARDPYLAVAGLAFSVGFLQVTEGAFWASVIDVGGTHAGAASGMMNMLGNLGGVVSTALVPILVRHFGWLFALGTGSALAIAGGLIWLGVRADEPLVKEG